LSLTDAPVFRLIQNGGVTLRAAMAGHGPLVIMVHGFPESWYSWRHQIGPIADAGFSVAAMDVRGYGGSSRPPQVEDYDLQSLIGDVIAVADALQPDAPVTLIGHDWGAPIVWNTALTRPERICAVAGLSVPYTGVPERPFSEVFTERFTKKNRFFYQAWFQQVGPPEAEAEADPRGFLRRFLYAISGDAPDGSWPRDKTASDPLLKGLIDPDPFPAWLTQADLDFYTGEFKRSGFFGPISRYRNHERDWRFLQAFKDRRIEQPTLFIAGDRDPAFTAFGSIDPVPILKANLPQLQGIHILPGCGHWTQQERPAEVTAHLLDWLKGL
jgi:pimeloyl-ACP methyl ester carboxylesterase